MYARGEDNFCPRYVETGAGADLGDCGMLDRSRIAKQNVKVVLCESPVVIGDWMANKQITQMELVRRQGEDSDEVAPAYRDDLAPGFRHDVAPWAGAAGDGIVGAEPAFVNRPIDLISLVVAALWVCGQRAALSKLVLQDKRHTHGPYGSALDMADL